jgi:hypothetical protein
MLEPGQTLGAYKLISPIGAGGMGEVWRAEDTRLGRVVAIKILAPSVAANPESVARMRREARTIAQLNHPNIATIHAFEEADGRTFIVMELVEGETLTAMIARGPLPESEVYRIGRGVADALAEAHAKDIVHRDIKPDNVIVSGSRVKVLDFGIAKRVGLQTTTSESPTGFVTQEGMIVGTIHYMSPEQALGKPLDTRTDIFSLGVVLYQAATGKQPFAGETVTETITQIIRDTPPAPKTINPAISPGLNAIIQRCMAKNRDERFASAADLALALAAPPTATYTTPTVQVEAAPPAKRGSAVWWIVAVVVVLVVIGTLAAFRHKRVAAATTVAIPAATPSTTTVEVAAPASQPTTTAAGVGGATLGGGAQIAEKPKVSATEHYDHGMTALLNHNMFAARNQFERALEHAADLTARQQQFARLGLALSTNDRSQAQRLAREIEDQNPGDPDLERIKRAFAEQQPRRRWVPRNH